MKKDKTLPPKPKMQKPLKHYLDDLNDIMGTEVTVLVAGQETVVTRQQAILVKITADATSGNPKAIKAVLEFFKIGIPTTKSSPPSPELRAAMDRWKNDSEAQIIALCDPTMK